MFSLSLLYLSGISENSSPSESWFWRVWSYCLRISYTIYAFPSSPIISISKEDDNSHPLASRVSKSQDLAWQRYWNLCFWVGVVTYLLPTPAGSHLGTGTKCLTNHLDLNFILNEELDMKGSKIVFCLPELAFRNLRVKYQLAKSLKIFSIFIWRNHLERLLLEAMGEYILM